MKIMNIITSHKKVIRFVVLVRTILLSAALAPSMAWGQTQITGNGYSEETPFVIDLSSEALTAPPKGGIEIKGDTLVLFSDFGYDDEERPGGFYRLKGDGTGTTKWKILVSIRGEAVITCEPGTRVYGLVCDGGSVTLNGLEADTEVKLGYLRLEYSKMNVDAPLIVDNNCSETKCLKAIDIDAYSSLTLNKQAAVSVSVSSGKLVSGRDYAGINIAGGKVSGKLTVNSLLAVYGITCGIKNDLADDGIVLGSNGRLLVSYNNNFTGAFSDPDRIVKSPYAVLRWTFDEAPGKLRLMNAKGSVAANAVSGVQAKDFWYVEEFRFSKVFPEYTVYADGIQQKGTLEGTATPVTVFPLPSAGKIAHYGKMEPYITLKITLPSVQEQKKGGYSIATADESTTVEFGSDFIFAVKPVDNNQVPIVTASPLKPLIKPNPLEPTTVQKGIYFYTLKMVRQDLNISVKMTDKATANETIAENDGITVRAAGGLLHIMSPGPATVSVYTIAGKLVRSVSSPGGELTLSAPPGICIVKVGDRTFKVIN